MRHRRQAAADPDRHRPAADDPDDAVIGMTQNPPIVEQKRIGNLPQLAAGRVVVDGHRLVARIAAGGHQRTVHHPHQCPVQRRVGDKGSHRGKPGCNLLGQGRASPAGEQQDRRLGAQQHFPGRFVDLGVVPHLLQILEQNGQRLAVPPLPLTQPADGQRRGRVADQMKAAHTLHGQDLAVAQQPRSLLEQREIRGIRAGITHIRQGTQVVSQLEPDSRTAPRASDILSVEPAVSRVGIFAQAFRAGREINHRGSLAVERCRRLDAEPRPAVGAA